MNDDAARERLAAAAPHADWCHEADRSPDFPCACDGYRREIADALLPVVREIAADELRAVAHRLDDGGDKAIEVALGGAPYVHWVLCDTAHALDGKA